MDDTHQFGTGFAVYKNLLSSVKEFNTIFECVSTIRLNTKPANIFIINVCAPIENKDQTNKNEFYEELARIYDEAPGNTIKIKVRDCNAKLGKEVTFIPTIGTHSAHKISNNNKQKFISFVISRRIIISSITFPHKNIHKYNWKSHDGRTVNQIYHVLIDTRLISSISDVRSYCGADCNTGHFTVISKFRLRLKIGLKGNTEIQPIKHQNR